MAQPVIRAGAATFVYVDMGGLSAQDAIKRTGHGLQGHGVRPRPVKHEKGEASLPNTSCILLVAASVQGSSPYPTA